MTETAWLDALGQAELVRKKEASAIELVEEAIARVEKLNPQLNAVIHQLYDKARASVDAGLPDGPFTGVPFVLKDLSGWSEGDPCHYGTRFLRDAGWCAPVDHELIARFRRAGFVFIGRTNAPELGAWTTTEPEAYGASHNPWDLDRSTGGSSGGSAAAVASGMVPAGHANDGGGSIRIPASECGLVGLKPTRGRVTMAPTHGEMWEGMAIDLAVTRSVRDTAAILDAVHGMAVGDPYTAPAAPDSYLSLVSQEPTALRIGVMKRLPQGAFGEQLHADCVAAVDATAHLLTELGHNVEEAHPPALDEDVLANHVVPVIAASQARDLEYWGEKIGRTITADDVDSDNWIIAEMGKGISATAYLAAVEQLHAWSRRVAEWWTTFDVLVTPTILEPPPPLGELVPRDGEPLAGFMRSGALCAFTLPFNVTGQPAISLPLHHTTLPIGVQFAGAFGREDLLISLAGQLERARPWADRRPPVSA